MFSGTRHQLINALRLAFTMRWISVCQFLHRDTSRVVWLRNIAKSKSFGRIASTADYVAALDLVEYMHSMHRRDLEDPKSRREAKLYNKSVDAKIALEDYLAVVKTTLEFRLQCLSEFATIVGYTDELVAEPVVFEVYSPHFFASDCIRTCMAASKVGFRQYWARSVVQMPRWAYDALPGVLAAEATACNTEESAFGCTDAFGHHKTTIGSPSPAPSQVHLESALVLWQSAGKDSLYYEFPAALLAASLV